MPSKFFIHLLVQKHLYKTLQGNEHPQPEILMSQDSAEPSESDFLTARRAALAALTASRPDPNGANQSTAVRVDYLRESDLDDFEASVLFSTGMFNIAMQLLIMLAAERGVPEEDVLQEVALQLESWGR